MSGTALPIDYLTRDYEGFRQLLVSFVDRSGTEWTERSAADVGMMVIELLAATLDKLAYAGDRVAQEGYIETARRRESVRRLAALGDYPLDRGQSTIGHQYFELAGGSTLNLPAGTQVAPPITPGQRSETRPVFETLAGAPLDGRWNELKLLRSVGPGSKVLFLGPSDASGGAQDLRALGLSRGMVLALLPRDGEQEGQQGELVTLARVTTSFVELKEPLRYTHIGVSRGSGGDTRRFALATTFRAESAADAGALPATRVLGNLVPIRRGRTEDWRFIGRGGAPLGEIPFEEFLQGRIDEVRRLREEVESSREDWLPRNELVREWDAAKQEMASVLAMLRRTVASAMSDADRSAVLDRLGGVAASYRALLTATGREVPEELLPSQRVSRRAQALDVPPGDLPPLWLDATGALPEGATDTLQVTVGVAGVWTRWTEVNDFLASAPDDPHYVVEVNSNLELTLRFGDGQSGALPPRDAQVMVRRVLGDPAGGDVGAGAITELPAQRNPSPAPALAAIASTFNPLATSGARAPEPTAGIAARLQQNLALPALPVTRDDYVRLLRARGDVEEASVSVRGSRVDVVIRPDPDLSAPDVLDSASAFLKANRLSGTDVRVRLAVPCYVSVTVIVEVHPDVSPIDLRNRLRRALRDLFGDRGERILGATRTRAEIYRVVEALPGVMWSQVAAFDLAAQPVPGCRELITPDPDAVVRCLATPEIPECGSLTILAARRYRLRLTLTYPTLDPPPPAIAALRAQVVALLSGIDSEPFRSRWPEITTARIEELFARDVHDCTLRVAAILVDGRAAARVTLLGLDVPVLDGLEIADLGLEVTA